MTERKLTKVQKFNAIAKALEGMNLTIDGLEFSVEDFVAHEIELIQKKAEGKKAKVSDATIQMREDALATLADGKGRTISEIIKDTPSFSGFVPQKVTPILTKLKDEGLVTVAKEKGKSVYTLA